MLLRNALYLKELRVGLPKGVRLKSMVSEMHSSNLPMPASDWKKDRELKISEDCSEQSELKISEDCGEQSEKSIIKGNSIESVEIEEIRSNPDKLYSMTVKELRTMARSVGMSTRGNKQELISSLKFLLFKGKTTISEDVPDNKQKQTKKRKQVVESSIAEDDSKCVPEYNELSVDTEEAIGARQSSLQKQVSSRVQRSQKVSTQISISVDSNEPWTMLAHKKPQKEWIPYNPRTMRSPSLDEDSNSIKLISWNVNGLRALLKLKSFPALQLAQQENFDVLCLQETKLQEKDVDLITKNLIDGYDNSYWTCSVSKLGYSGTAIVSKKKPISVNYGLGILDHDTEGRIVTVEFDTFYLISGYVPNSGDGLRRLAYRVEQWDPSLSNYMKELEKVKPVILAGDLNCAHEEIDIYDPAGNRQSAGFTNEERESFQKNFLCKGFVDTFRRQHPSVVAYTYWGYRHGGRKTNKGWRLDYFLVSEKIADKVHDSYILPHVGGSDHCPIGLILKL